MPLMSPFKQDCSERRVAKLLHTWIEERSERGGRNETAIYGAETQEKTIRVKN